MVYREKVGYGKRVKNAIAGVVVGLAMFGGSFVVLAWNEKDAVRQTGAITEIDKVSIADVPSGTVDPNNEGQLVHMPGSASTEDHVGNPAFGIDEVAIRLSWDSDIYQVEEDRDEDDEGNVSYTYNKKWVDRPVDSSGFKDPGEKAANQGSTKTLPADAASQANNVDLDAFQLNQNLIGRIGNAEAYPVAEIPAAFEGKGTLSDGSYYTGDPGNLQVGDERIAFRIVRSPQDVTVMATQRSSSFEPYMTKVGVAKEILYMGQLTKPQVIKKQRTEAMIKRWLFRGGGFLLMWLGLGLVFKPLQAVASVIPFGAKLVGGATGIITFLIATCLSLVTVSVFWFVYRPVLSTLLLVGAAAAVFGIIYLRRKKAAGAVDAGPYDEYDEAERPPPPPVAG